MAKISSHNARKIAQVRATRPDEPDTWITLTLTSDGRLLRKITSAHRSQWGTHYSNSNNTVLSGTQALPDRTRADWESRLTTIARRLGYTEPKV